MSANTSSNNTINSQLLLTGQSYHNFIQTVHSPFTRIAYKNSLSLYLRYLNISECEMLLEQDPKVNRIDKMSEEKRKEILELLRAEADKTAEEYRRGEHFMDEIEKYANTLNEEERKLFYGNLNERWNRVLREESKRLSKLWK